MNSNTSIQDVFKLIEEKYKDDSFVLIATAKDNVPTVRAVDSFFYDGSFWIATDKRCNYVQEIMSNPFTMISDGAHNRFWCKAVLRGHPLDEANKNIREIYTKKFSWYFDVNNEESKETCYIKVTPYKGYIHKDKIGYTFNGTDDTIVVDSIKHHIDAKIVPFFE